MQLHTYVHYVTLAYSLTYILNERGEETNSRAYSVYTNTTSFTRPPYIICTHTNIAAEYYPFVQQLAGLFYVQQFMRTMKSALYERYDERG